MNYNNSNNFHQYLCPDSQIVSSFQTIEPGLAAKEFKIVQYWNGVANKNKKVTLAVKANDQIEECTWINLDTDEEYT